MSKFTFEVDTDNYVSVYSVYTMLGRLLGFWERVGATTREFDKHDDPTIRKTVEESKPEASDPT